MVDTDMSNFAKAEAGHGFTLGIQSRKRIATPEDIAPVLVFLASNDARWVTGDTVHVDGGSNLRATVAHEVVADGPPASTAAKSARRPRPNQTLSSVGYCSHPTSIEPVSIRI